MRSKNTGPQGPGNRDPSDLPAVRHRGRGLRAGHQRVSDPLGLPAIREIGLFKFLFGQVWDPTNTTTGAQYGILPFILTSIYGTAGPWSSACPSA